MPVPLPLGLSLSLPPSLSLSLATSLPAICTSCAGTSRALEGPLLQLSKRKVQAAKSPRREVVRSSAGVDAIPPPFFGGRSRSIPQGMILDVQPLVRSLFCPTKQSPNGFFDFGASIPVKLDNIFKGGGVVGGAGGGGQKFVERRGLEPKIAYSRPKCAAIRPPTVHPNPLIL